MSGSHHEGTAQGIEIDAGVRAWYKSCRCCLSDAHPDAVAVLDAERDAAKQERADAGICEVAEGTDSNSGEVASMAKTLDPICDMVVDIEEQRGRGLTLEHEGTTYAFCAPGCKRTFEKDPAKYTAKVAQWKASAGH
jgi:YHS domain-containing protein